MNTNEKRDILKINNKDMGEVDVKALHLAFTGYLSGQREGTASAKTRAEVRGGGKKPWRQKGLGRARAGSIRSPLWRGGGVIFGPKPRDYSIKLNKKFRKLALRTALFEKKENLMIVDKLNVSEIKTKEVKKILNELKINDFVLWIFGEKNEKALKAAKNLKEIKLIPVEDINIYDVLKYPVVCLEKDCLEKLEKVLK